MLENKEIIRCPAKPQKKSCRTYHNKIQRKNVEGKHKEDIRTSSTAWSAGARNNKIQGKMIGEKNPNQAGIHNQTIGNMANKGEKRK